MVTMKTIDVASELLDCPNEDYAFGMVDGKLINLTKVSNDGDVVMIHGESIRGESDEVETVDAGSDDDDDVKSTVQLVELLKIVHKGLGADSNWVKFGSLIGMITIPAMIPLLFMSVLIGFVFIVSLLAGIGLVIGAVFMMVTFFEYLFTSTPKLYSVIVKYFGIIAKHFGAIAKRFKESKHEKTF